MWAAGAPRGSLGVALPPLPAAPCSTVGTSAVVQLTGTIVLFLGMFMPRPNLCTDTAAGA